MTVICIWLFKTLNSLQFYAYKPDELLAHANNSTMFLSVKSKPVSTDPLSIKTGFEWP